MSVEAVLVPGSFGWVQLQLHYDGRRPPLGLLADIADLGWSVPPPPSRPASAIDWYTPDPMTGERFTVRPWRAVHDIVPPGRNAARSTWDAEARTRALRALAPVLMVHEVQVTSPVAELATLATAVRAAENPTAPTPVTPGRAGHLPVVVSFTAPADRLERIEGFLRSTGLSFVAATEMRTRRQVYRGSPTSTDVMVVVGEVVVRADRSEALRARLRDEQALAQERPAAPDDLHRIDARARQAGAADGAGSGPLRSSGPPQVAVRLDLTGAATGVVDRIVAHPALAGLGMTVDPGTRAEPVEDQGSEDRVERPCLHLEVSCPVDRADLVRAVLAQESGLPGDRVALVTSAR